MLWVNKEEVCSPTMITESVVLSAIIDAKEEIEVTVVDTPHAYINKKLKSHHENDIVKVKGA